MRGENLDTAQAMAKHVGTSPRARGKPCTPCATAPGGRNIPACAGKTALAISSQVFMREHPRVRGENPKAELIISEPTGTSPRARGKPREQLDQLSNQRNIPACAGKTFINPKVTGSLKEHPRVRGENTAHCGGETSL